MINAHRVIVGNIGRIVGYRIAYVCVLGLVVAVKLPVGGDGVFSAKRNGYKIVLKVDNTAVIAEIPVAVKKLETSGFFPFSEGVFFLRKVDKVAVLR